MRELLLNIKSSFTIRGTATKAISVGADKFTIDWP